MSHIYTEGYVIIAHVLGGKPVPMCLDSDGAAPWVLCGLRSTLSTSKGSEGGGAGAGVLNATSLKGPLH